MPEEWAAKVWIKMIWSEDDYSSPSSELEQLHSGFLLDWLIIQPWKWRRHVPPKLQLNFNILHSVMSQKIGFSNSSVSKVSGCGLRYLGSIPPPPSAFKIPSPPRPDKRFCPMRTGAQVGIGRFLELDTDLGIILRALHQLPPHFFKMWCLNAWTTLYV
jgi:hypothetical protein